ncbi:MAG: carbohydrate-binding module family 20 domain-containing protein [Sandaracinaceae bacterium]
MAAPAGALPRAVATARARALRRRERVRRGAELRGGRRDAPGPRGLADPGVGFTATAETSFGESIYVRGDALRWARGTGSNFRAFRDGPMRYPVWTSPATIALPLGATVEWKLTASYGDAASVRWERGRRRAFVQPAASSRATPLS